MKANTATTAVIFPGQGSQSLGMLSALYEAFPIVRKTYDEASDILGFDLWALTAKGPAEALNETINTQPAMLVAGVACWRVLQEQAPFTPAYFAGHSLGEYTALVASEQLSFRDAVVLARKRAEAMQAAVPVGVGAMAAVLGSDAQTVDAICQAVSTKAHQVWPANDNAPGQIVIAGHKVAVEQACSDLQAAGAKRALLLPVSVPSHCPLMQPAADMMLAALPLVKWSPTTAPLIHNSDVLPHNEASAVIRALGNQLTQPVRWVETIGYFATHGVTQVIEVGPGKVLAGLNRRIEKTIQAKPLFDMASLAEVVCLIKGNQTGESK